MPKDIAEAYTSLMAVWDPAFQQVLPGKWSMWEGQDEEKQRQNRGRGGQ